MDGNGTHLFASEASEPGPELLFYQTAQSTSGAASLFDAHIPAGRFIGDHYHQDFDEEITAISGQLMVTLRGTQRVLAPGEAVCIPRGAPHSWANVGPGPVCFRTRTSPGHAGFEQMLRVTHGLQRDGLTRANGMPRDFSTAALLAAWSDSRFPGALAILNPFLRLAARRACARGLDRELLLRYGPEHPICRYVGDLPR